jgi:hypothetical protein
MLRYFKRLIAPVLAIVLLVVNMHVYTAHAIWWGGYHWDKGGTVVQIQEYNYAGYFADAEAARVNKWNNIGILYNYRVNYHTDVSVFDGNFGATGWAGLASLETLNWDWGCWCYDHIGHGHARYNSYYGGSDWYIQGVFCQEVYHTYGFQHDNSGGCMGLGYYAGSSNVMSAYNVNDFYARYRYH